MTFDDCPSTGTFEQRADQTRAVMSAADVLIIGGGAGLSDAAGLTYSGERFTGPFQSFIERYGMTDMYTASFYPFQTEEERWAYWALLVGLNRYDAPATDLYRTLLELLGNKPYFVITTNVDHQFQKAGFLDSQVWSVQGDYGWFQCSSACHRTLYPNEEAVRRIRSETRDCRIPADLVPRCPVCSGPIDVNVRKNRFFVQDDAWETAQANYTRFIADAQGARIALLELGVGFNTPSIIRYPFERLTFQSAKTSLIRLNKNDCIGVDENRDKTIPFTENMNTTLRYLVGLRNA